MSEPTPAASGDFFSKHRIEALADGVFAVVMTLLVLEIKPELADHADDAAVGHTLRALALPVLAYAFAFMIACIFWHLHHRKFQLLRHTNPVHTGLTLAFLFALTLLPLSISLFLHAKNSGLAQAVYFGNFTLIALLLLASWLQAHSAGLVDAGAKPGAAANITRRILAMCGLGVVATLASYFKLPYLVLFFVPVLLYLRHRKPAAS